MRAQVLGGADSVLFGAMPLLVAATELELCGRAGLVCGVGPVEAAAAVAAALERERPDAVLHVGVAGARQGNGIDVLDVVVGSEAVYEDLVTVRKLAPSSVLPHPALLESARGALPSAHVLPIGTTGRVGGSNGCRVEAMEGFAVLRACELAGVPAVEVRVISNLVEDDRSAWRLEEALGVLDGVIAALLRALD
jgi:futalosine hydrolase